MDSKVVSQKPTYQNLDILDRYLVPEDIKKMCHSATCNNCGGRIHFTGNELSDGMFSLLFFCEKCDLFTTDTFKKRSECEHDKSNKCTLD